MARQIIQPVAICVFRVHLLPLSALKTFLYYSCRQIAAGSRWPCLGPHFSYCCKMMAPGIVVPTGFRPSGLAPRGQAPAAPIGTISVSVTPRTGSAAMAVLAKIDALTPIAARFHRPRLPCRTFINDPSTLRPVLRNRALLHGACCRRSCGQAGAPGKAAAWYPRRQTTWLSPRDVPTWLSLASNRQGNRIWQNASARVPLMRIVCGSQIEQARITRSTRKSRLSDGVHGKEVMALRTKSNRKLARSAMICFPWTP